MTVWRLSRTSNRMSDVRSSGHTPGRHRYGVSRTTAVLHAQQNNRRDRPRNCCNGMDAQKSATPYSLRTRGSPCPPISFESRPRRGQHAAAQFSRSRLHRALRTGPKLAAVASRNKSRNAPDVIAVGLPGFKLIQSELTADNEQSLNWSADLHRMIFMV